MEISFGRWVKQRRTALGLTQRELAHQIGCSLSVIQKIEIDERRPSRAIAELLAHHLEIGADEQEIFVRLARARTLAQQLSPGQSSPPAERFDNLPAPLTPLVGREWEVATLRTLLLPDGVRLLTISGPPGIGKTRLALGAAHRLSGDFDHGACFVELAPLAAGSYVVPAIARTLGVGERERQPLIELLKVYLRRRQLLLVLDNFEHVLDAAPQVAELLQSAPNLTVLVTSRAPLQLYGEHEFEAPPLALPDLKRLPAATALLSYAAIELFVQRARAAKLDFVLGEQNARSVAKLCVHLDGLPLAIELAAARSKQLSPETLLARLTNPRGESAAHLALLAASMRNLPSRQQTLYAAIDWSYNLLTPVEQRVFRSLGVFAGGCSLAAVRAVHDVPGEATATWLLDVMHSLVDKSLAVLQPNQDGEPRFNLLEMIREYALHQLAANGELERVRQAHATYFLAMGAIIEQQDQAGQRPAIMAAFPLEHDNLREALNWAVQHDPAEGLLLAAALADFWNDHGLVPETRQWLTKVLTCARPEHSRRYALVTRRMGCCLMMQGDYYAAQEWLDKSVVCWRTLGDLRELGIALQFLAGVLYFRNEYAAAVVPAQEAVTHLRAGKDMEWLAIALNTLGAVRVALTEFTMARLVLEESLALFVAQNNDWGVALSLLAMADIPYAIHGYGEARDMLEKALQIFRRLDNLWFVAQTQWYLGKALWHQGHSDLSISCWAESIAIGREIGAKEFVAGSLLHLGFAALQAKDASLAHVYFGESLVFYQQMQHNAGIGYALSGLAGAVSLRDIEQSSSHYIAAKLLGAATALLATRRKPMDDLERSEYERILASLRNQLSTEVFAAAWAAGWTMSLEEAIAHALAMQ